MRRLLLTLAAASVLPPSARAQSPAAGRYLATASWVQPFLDHMDRAGSLPAVDPLTRPLRRTAVAGALAGADTAALDAATLGTLRRLERDFVEPGHREVRWSVEGVVGALGASDASRWVLRPQQKTARLFPQVSVEGALELPHVSFVTTPVLDNRLKYDSLFRGRQDRSVAGRNVAAYALGSFRWFEVFFGRVDRNWGPPELDGLLVSPAPYSAEHLLVRIGPDWLRLEMIAAQLDAIVPWDSVTPMDRWQVSHRLVVEPSRRMAFSLGESVIYAGSDLPWRYLNPLTLGLLTITEGAPEANALLSADVRWQVAARLRLFGQLLADDFQIDHKTQADREPPAYGFTLGGSGGVWRGRLAWTASYTRVSNLAYRTPRNEHQYTLDGVGVARNWSDYDEATVRATVMAAPGLLLGASVTLQRQGEGDMRERYPDINQFADSLAFLTGTVQRAVQPGLEAAWAPSPWVSLAGCVARRTLSNAGNVAGASEDRWVWRIGATLRRRVGHPGALTP